MVWTLFSSRRCEAPYTHHSVVHKQLAASGKNLLWIISSSSGRRTSARGRRKLFLFGSNFASKIEFTRDGWGPRNSCKNFISTQVYSLSHNELIGREAAEGNGNISSVNASSPTHPRDCWELPVSTPPARSLPLFIIHSLSGVHIGEYKLEHVFILKWFFMYLHLQWALSPTCVCQHDVTDAHDMRLSLSHSFPFQVPFAGIIKWSIILHYGNELKSEIIVSEIKL